MESQLFDIYNDLDDFDRTQRQLEENGSYKDLLEKYEQAVKEIDELKNENRELKAKVENMNNNFSSLLLTAKAEITRKDNQIKTLKSENDDMCFRRYKGNANSVSHKEAPRPSTMPVRNYNTVPSTNKIDKLH